MSNAGDFVIENGVLTKYTGPGGDVVIPDGVTSIGAWAFASCSSLTSAVIPKGVTSIGDYAFTSCSSLESVVIPDGVTSIGEGAFAECSSLESVVIPKGVTSIGDSVFWRCDSLESVVIPDGVTSIGENEFSYCRSLKSVVIPDGVTSIGKWAFNYCSRLTSVVIPDGVTSIDGGTFRNCSSLKSVVIPEGVISIGGGAFWGCTSLESVVIPDGVTSIGEGAFGGCNMLAKDGLIIVRNRLYGSVGKLRDVVIPDGVTSIGEGAFAECTSLESVVIPKGVTSISDSVFWRCDSLESVVIPDGVTSIGKWAFNYCTSLKSAVIPDGVTSIGESAFSYCSSLKSVVIPEGVTSIGADAFRECSSLKSVVIPDGVTSIGERTFVNCRSLKSIEIPESVISIGEDAFYDCKKLEYISPLNPSCKMGGKTFTSVSFPSKLYSCLGGIYHAMPDSMLKDVLLKLNWSHLSQETQTELFVYRQGKPLLSVYPKCIRGKEVESLGRRLLEQLSGVATGKLCKAAVNYMILLEKDIPDDLLNQLYTSLKGQKNAAKLLKTIEDHISLMERLKMDTTVDENLSLLEKLILEKLLAEKQSVKDLENKLKRFYSLTFKDLPELLNKDGSIAAPFVFAWLLTVHEKMEEREDSYSPQDVTASYEQPGVCPDAGKILDELDPDALQQALSTLANDNLGIIGRSKKMFLAYPICRFANEELMTKLTKTAPSWRSSVSGNEAPPLLSFRWASLYSETRAAMLFAEKYHDLSQYAQIRDTDADTIRDQYLSDVGLDAQGEKAYDLGNQTVVARLQKDLSFLVEVPGAKKPTKSIPKKGADEDKYTAANADFSEMKKSVKKIIKNRSNTLFEDFLSGRKRNAAGWKQAYLNNPLLRMVASLLVWQQNGHTFTLTDTDAVDAKGDPFKINDRNNIILAHPMEMRSEEVTAWQKYFTSRGLKQPFEQIWESVVESEKVTEDRYAGCMIPYYRFIGQEKRGIHVEDYDYHNEINISFDDCDAQVERIDWLRHMIEMDDRFEIKQFSFKTFSRKVNHIVAYLDRITIYERIRKDDVTVQQFLSRFTLAQITQFIQVASESSAANVMAILLDYKNSHFADFDPMEEFSLEL